MKSVILQINDLIDQHEDYPSCEGCPLCDKIKQLRDTEREPEVKFKHILDKGPEMTRSEIEFLLDNEVRKQHIQKALNLNRNDFYTMLYNFGLSKKKPKGEMRVRAMDITPEEFVQLHYVQGLSYDRIAEMKNVKKPAITNWKWRNKEVIEKLIESAEPREEKAEVSEPKNNVDQSEIEKLKNYIAYVEKLNKGLTNNVIELEEKVKDMEAIHNACDDVESEIDSLQEEIKHLQKENEAFRNLLKMVL